MYVANVTIDNTEDTIVYPVVLGVVSELKRKLGITDVTPVTFGDNPPLYITRDGSQQMEHIPDILNEELHIEYTVVNTDATHVMLSRAAATGLPLYVDNNIHTKISPILRRKMLTINLTYYCKSKTLASRLVNRVAGFGSRDVNSTYHDIEYFYYIPNNIVLLVSAFNDLKNTHAPTKVLMDDYVAATFNNQAGIINSETGNDSKARLIVREKQDGVIGTITTDNFSITKDEDSNTSRWSVSLEYVLEYEAPDTLTVMYPILIHNQPLPAQYRIDPPKDRNDSRVHTIGEVGLATQGDRTPDVLKIPSYSYYLHIPNQDMLVLPTPQSSYIRLFSAVAVLDPAALTKLFYLDELPGITMHPLVVELLKLESAFIGKPLESIFYLELYDNTQKMYAHKVIPTAVTMLVNGVSTDRVLLSTTIPMNISNLVRVCFNIMTDLSMLATPLLTRLKANIEKVNSLHPLGSNVLDTLYSVLNIDLTMINKDYIVTPNTTSLDIALNIHSGVSNRVRSKQVALSYVEIFKSK